VDWNTLHWRVALWGRGRGEDPSLERGGSFSIHSQLKLGESYIINVRADRESV